MRKRIVLVPLAAICCLFLSCNEEKGFVLSCPGKQATVWLSPNAPAPLKLAFEDLSNDVEKITGTRLPEASHEAEPGSYSIYIGEINDAAFRKAVGPGIEPYDTLAGKWENYVVKTFRDEAGALKLLIVGSDARGTMFGIYHFIENYLGVDPYYYWTSMEPAKRTDLIFHEVLITENGPDFKFRGWFINDEDLLTEFKNGGGRRNIDYPFYGQVVHPETIRPVLETMVRARFNLVIPASFIDILNAPERKLVEEAHKRGLFISQHHIEPLGVSAFSFFNYWKDRGKSPKFSFYSNREELEEVWNAYAEAWSAFPNVIWQVGLRGIADRPMWMADPDVPQTDAERGELISQAMEKQVEIIQTVVKEDDPFISTTLWAEGSGFMAEGHLNVPENVIIVFADNSPGWMWQRDFYNTPRTKDHPYGVYYHHQIWSSGPHLIQAVPPAKTYEMFGLAYERASNDYLIMNVSNVREFALGIDASGQMLWDMQSFDPGKFLAAWCHEKFGKEGTQAKAAYELYFSAFSTRGQYDLPFLLDGHTKNIGLGLLDQIDQSMDKNKTGSRPRRDQEVAEWARRFLPGMLEGKDLDDKELQQQVVVQLEKMKEALAMAESISEQMNGPQKIFLETNLEVQAKIMIGLGEWLKHVMQAKERIMENEVKMALFHLDEAVTGLSYVKNAQRRASHGPWEHWYRGDKKMNIEHMIGQTREAMDKISQNRAQ